MKHCILALSDVFLLVCAGAIFVILFVTIHQALKQMSLFRKKTSVVVAICVSLLCIIGLHQHFFATTDDIAITADGDKPVNGFNFLLLPYTALALAILLTLLLLFLFKKFGGERPESLSKYREGLIERLRRSEKSDEETRIGK